jgi:hypothetical protein
VNFLSHYYLDHPIDDPYYVCGMALPDLWKGFSRKFNRKIRNAEPWTGNLESLSLESGIYRHFEADRHFHNAAFFRKQQAYMRKSLTDILHPNQFERLTFMGHVLFEIMLDRKVMQAFPQVLDRYYELLDKVDPDSLLEYMELRGLSAEVGRFFDYFYRFREVRFLYHYREEEGLIQALLRVYGMATGSKVEGIYHLPLQQLVTQLDKHLEPTWEGYFVQLREKISDAP